MMMPLLRCSIQLLRLNVEGQLAQGEWCLTPRGVRVEANHCTKGTVNGPWTYEEVVLVVSSNEYASVTRIHKCNYRYLFCSLFRRQVTSFTQDLGNASQWTRLVLVTSP